MEFDPGPSGNGNYGERVQAPVHLLQLLSSAAWSTRDTRSVPLPSSSRGTTKTSPDRDVAVLAQADAGLVPDRSYYSSEAARRMPGSGSSVRSPEGE
jgi:hypothetical protein